MSENSSQFTSSTKVISQEALDHMRIREVLATVAGEGATSEDAVVRHAVPKNKVSIPEDMPTAKAAKILAEATTAEQEEQDFVLNFTANPYDGAVAFHNVLKTAVQYKTDMRTAAYVVAIDRVAQVTRLRGMYA